MNQIYIITTILFMFSGSTFCQDIIFGGNKEFNFPDPSKAFSDGDLRKEMLSLGISYPSDNFVRKVKGEVRMKIDWSIVRRVNNVFSFTGGPMKEPVMPNLLADLKKLPLKANFKSNKPEEVTRFLNQVLASNKVDLSLSIESIPHKKDPIFFVPAGSVYDALLNFSSHYECWIRLDGKILKVIE